jgi:hypothetical protein
VLQQVGVGGVVDVGLDHGGVDPQLAGPQQLAGGQLGDQGGVQLLDDLGAGPMRHNRRHEIESLTSRHRRS